MTNLKELAIKEFNTFGEWLRGDPTIFENDKHLVWITNQDGWCVMEAMQKNVKLTGRRYTKALIIGYCDPQEGWKISEHLEASYPVWVQATKRLWGVV